MNADAPDTGSQSGPDLAPGVSVVVPVRNEADNIAPLIAEIRAALAGHAPFEIVYVDDGSNDATPDALKREAETCAELHVCRHAVSAGQSAAIRTGVRHARAPVIVTLDGDGQNDPADIPALLAAYAQAPDQSRLMIAGHRADRRDPWLKRISSRIANAVRAGLLGDATPDTGCGLKVFARGTYLDLPAFDHMHRFLPALMIRGGGRVVSVVVHHRPRERGVSNYGLFDRLGVGITDLFGVLWLKRRGLKTPPDSDA
ncbi:MAG: glycosyltransferase family 2 protein [Rhodospirillales bacterium]|nr:glycosyltransferase family 2 protein [Rhodospirillales bacterium]